MKWKGTVSVFGMEVGLYLVTQYDASRPIDHVPTELIRQTELARESGFDSVHVGEHHVTQDDQYLLNEAVISYLADRVGEMWLCPTIVLLPYHHPVRIAEFGATVDVLSNGRFRLGVGLGYRQEEFDAFGIDREEAPGRLTEGVEIIKRLWTENTVTFDGEYFSLDEVSIRPQPLQDPRPPIWVGASNPSSVRRAAHIGDRFLGAHVPFDLAKKQVAGYRDEREHIGTEVGGVGFIREAFVAETEDAAEESVRTPLMEKYESYSSWGQDDVIGDDDFDSPWERLKHDRFLIGTPDQVVESIERYEREMNIDHLVVRMQFPGSDFEAVRDSIRLFGNEVLPRVK